MIIHIILMVSATQCEFQYSAACPKRCSLIGLFFKAIENFAL